MGMVAAARAVAMVAIQWWHINLAGDCARRFYVGIISYKCSGSYSQDIFECFLFLPFKFRFLELAPYEATYVLIIIIDSYIQPFVCVSSFSNLNSNESPFESTKESKIDCVLFPL